MVESQRFVEPDTLLDLEATRLTLYPIENGIF
jgi:hypothetical protein